ncbi:MAG: hypothetical protein HRU40_20570 [Saprospiraceae bacterium]|nr:hypothetical protein [Saprospiraceae bacterium]
MSSSRFEVTLLLVATCILVVGHFINLGVQPLYLEEPRRTIISMEMVANQNLWVPTLLGEFYYNKPPIYNWLLIGSTRISGEWAEGALRIPNVLSLLLWAVLIFRVGRQQFDVLFGTYSALLLVCCGSFLYYFSLIAEIDLFYSLITWSSIMIIFDGVRRKKWLYMFSAVYSLAAIGFLTKGLPSIAFAGISLLVWLIYTRSWKKLFSWQHFTGITLFLIIAGGYYFMYSLYADPTPFLTRIWTESSNRTVSQSAGVGDFLLHLITFPLSVWANILPAAGLLVFFAFRLKRYAAIHQNPFLVFCSLMLLANIAIYWLSPAERIRYVYMLFPFLIYLLVWLWRENPAVKWEKTALRIGSGILLHLFAIAAVALPFIPDLQVVPGIGIIAISFTCLFSVTIWFFWRKPHLPLPHLLVGIALTKCLFALTILPQRALDGGAQRDMVRAEKIYALIGEAPLYTVGSDKVIAYTSTAYLNRLRKNSLRRNDNLNVGAYYLVTKGQLPIKPVEVLLD